MGKKQKLGAILVATGLIFVLCGLGIHLLQEQEEKLAEQTAELLLKQLDNPTILSPKEPENAVTQYVPTLPTVTYMGFDMIGSIYIPSVGLYLPVLNEWDEESLKAAPCRYQGSIAEGNMIIMGHNYRKHFRPLHDVKEGAEVIFENVLNKQYKFRVAEIKYLHRTQGELLPSKYPLSVFTCTPGGLERIILRCEMVE